MKKRKRNRNYRPRKNPLKTGKPKNVLEQQFMGKDYQKAVEEFEPVAAENFTGSLPQTTERIQVYAQRVENGEEINHPDDRNVFGEDD